MMRIFALILFLWSGVHSLATSTLEQHHNVQYLTFTEQDRKNPRDIRDVSFADMNGQTTLFIIHGYAPTSLDQPFKLVNDIFDHHVPNVSRVVVVSWIDYATASSTVTDEYNTPSYYKVATQHVPAMAADLNEKLMYVRGKGDGRLELLGHCVGAHVAAQAGKLFRRSTGDGIDKIIGLDPAGLYWSTHPHEALQSGIAKELTVLHTNMDKYGFPKTIGTNDQLVNGGRRQPNCKRKLTADLCSHNEAWQAYANYLKEDSSVPVHKLDNNRPYVLCMDISESMRNNNRLTIAVDAAKQLISNVVNGTRMGIVTFNRDGVAVHDIVQTNGIGAKSSLIASLPKMATGATSIGAGLRASMALIKKLAMSDDDESCSTIILISDGEQTAGETPYDVLPELQRSCVTINSIGLGVDASQDLENVSAETGGQVYYVIEGGDTRSAQMADTVRALLYSYESELDEDDRSIHLPSNEIDLDATGDAVVPIQIEENIGKDTEISLIADDVDDVDMTLTSPNGQDEYTSQSPEFESSLMRQFFEIGLLEPGHYNLTVSKRSPQSRRSVRSRSSSKKAIVMVKTHQLNETLPVVRLDASVSSRILNYPKSKVILSAELRVDKFPVIHAELYANIKGLNQEIIQLKLSDDGTFPDVLANDGVYTAGIVKLAKPERYAVTVTATSNGTARMATRTVDYFLRQKTIDCRWPTCSTLRLRPFQRETDVGSIKLLANDDGEEESSKIPTPSSVIDLRAIVPYDDQKLVILQWTCPSDRLNIKYYDIRVLIGNETFDDAFQFGDEYTVNGTTSEDAKNCTDGKTMVKLHIPDRIWEMRQENVENDTLELRFALKAVGVNGVKSERSNVAVAVFRKSSPPANSNRCVTVYRRTKIGIVRMIYC